MHSKPPVKNITDAAEPVHYFGLERVTDETSLKEEWDPLLREIFTDPSDLEDIDLLLERFAEPEKNTFSLLRNHEGKPVGIRLMQTHPDVPKGMYIPWGGVTAEYRNHGIYPKMVDETIVQMKQMGVSYTLHDFEDPARIAKAYPDDPEGAVKIATKRLNFFRRTLDCLVVDDKDIPYVRPASDDESQVQAYDLLAVSFADKNDPEIKQALGPDGRSIKKSFYREKYIEMAVLQYGNLGENGLKQQFPAIKQFLDVLDKSPKQYVNLYAPPLVPKATMDMPVKINTKDFGLSSPA